MGIEDAYLGYDFLDGAGGGRPERGGGAVGLAAGAHAAGPPGEPRRPRRERRHRGAPCIIIDGSIADRGRRRRPPRRRPAPPLAFAFCTRHPTSATVSGRVSQCANSRSSTTLSAGAPGAGISGGSCSRSTCSASASAAALRSAASIPPLSSPSPPIRSGRTRGAAWRGESELGVARGATWGGRRGWFNAAASRISAQSQPSDPVHLGCCTGSTALYAMQGGSPTDAHDVKN